MVSTANSGKKVSDAFILFPELEGSSFSPVRKKNAVEQITGNDTGDDVCETNKKDTSYAGKTIGVQEYGASQSSDGGAGKGLCVISEIKRHIAGEHHSGGSSCR